MNEHQKADLKESIDESENKVKGTLDNAVVQAGTKKEELLDKRLKLN